MGKNSGEIHRNCSKRILFFSFPKKNEKLVTKSLAFLRSFRRNYHEFFETKSQNSDPRKISQLGVQFPRISRRIFEELVTRTCSQEIPRKFFLSNSSKLKNLGKFFTFVTWVISHFLVLLVIFL